jgi:hypothetical protein
MSTPTVKSLEDGLLDEDESYLVLSEFLTLNNVSSLMQNMFWILLGLPGQNKSFVLHQFSIRCRLF